MKFQKGHRPHNTGKHWSKEIKEKIGKAHRGKKRPIFTEETKRKMSKNNARYWLGKKLPRKMIKKISKAGIGRKHSEITKRKMRDAQRRKKHWNWQGGISDNPYPIDWTETLRRAIRERDNYICQLCSQYGNIVHHKDYDKKNCNPDNLITLCRGCNAKVNFNRDYWISYFKGRQIVAT